MVGSVLVPAFIGFAVPMAVVFVGVKMFDLREKSNLVLSASVVGLAIVGAGLASPIARAFGYPTD
ncbi:MAG: hypothetical protein CMA77_05430 [Euryarchaeota archaeon]|jgi:asparagine N-glycosylation enzyme membrane subunit Stt3|nr:hypothetical protein [Euryarchaeota archaeon]